MVKIVTSHGLVLAGYIFTVGSLVLSIAYVGITAALIHGARKVR